MVTAAWARLQKSKRLGSELVPRELVPYLGSMSALLGGERVLTAVPFGLIVK